MDYLNHRSVEHPVVDGVIKALYKLVNKLMVFPTSYGDIIGNFAPELRTEGEHCAVAFLTELLQIRDQQWYI